MAVPIGYGSIFAYETTPGLGTFTDVIQVVTIDDPDNEIGEVDTSHLLTPDRAMTYTSGMFKGGEAKLEILFDAPQHTALYLLRFTDRLYRITFSQGSTMTWLGFIKKIRIGKAEMEKPITSEMTFKVSGLPVFVE